MPHGYQMRAAKLLEKILEGHVQNVSFRDLVALAEAMGFELIRVSGSHHIFVHNAVPHPLNLQSAQGRAKPYQVRQFRTLITRYDLRLR